MKKMLLLLVTALVMGGQITAQPEPVKYAYDPLSPLEKSNGATSELLTVVPVYKSDIKKFTQPVAEKLQNIAANAKSKINANAKLDTLKTGLKEAATTGNKNLDTIFPVLAEKIVIIKNATPEQFNKIVYDIQQHLESLKIAAQAAGKSLAIKAINVLEEAIHDAENTKADESGIPSTALQPAKKPLIYTQPIGKPGTKGYKPAGVRTGSGPLYR